MIITRNKYSIRIRIYWWGTWWLNQCVGAIRAQIFLYTRAITVKRKYSCQSKSVFVALIWIQFLIHFFIFYLSRRSRSSIEMDDSCAFVFDSVVDVVMIAITIIYSRTVKHSYLEVNDILVWVEFISVEYLFA